MAHKDKKEKKKRKAKKEKAERKLKGKGGKKAAAKKIKSKKAEKSKKDIKLVLEETRCTCCGKHCPLSKPRCGKGRAMAKKLVEKFA